jgi:hypothetical protein
MTTPSNPNERLAQIECALNKSTELLYLATRVLIGDPEAEKEVDLLKAEFAAECRSRPPLKVVRAAG